MAASLRTTATVTVRVPSQAITVYDGPSSSEISATATTPEEALARLARFTTALTEAVAEAADEFEAE